MADERAPLDWYIEACVVCGCQLGPGVGSRTSSGRCVHSEHHQRGGAVVRVVPRSVEEQTDGPSSQRLVARLAASGPESKS